jgi:hypothetical protein
MELTGLRIALAGLIVALVATMPPFALKFPKTALWLNWVAAVFAAFGGAVAVFAYTPAKNGALMPAGRGRGPLRASLFAALFGSVVATIGGVVATLRDTGNGRTLAEVTTAIGILTVIRVIQTLNGPTTLEG